MTATVPDAVTPVAVQAEWSGETCFILGGGPSLKGLDAEILRGRGRVIAINNAYQLWPWCDILYFGDRQWYEWHREHLVPFRGRMVTVSQLPGVPGIRRLRMWGSPGLSPHRDHLTGNNSGHQAISLAVHLGVKRIILLGFDMDTDGNQTHWHEGHPDHVTPERRLQILQERMLPRFASLKAPLEQAGVQVINANPNSALTCWPRMTLAEAMSDAVAI